MSETRHGWAWWASTVALVLGAGGLAWMIHRTGLSVMIDTVRGAAPALALTCLFDLISTLMRARALHIFMRPSQRMVSYPRVVISQAAANAIHDVTPTGALGEATRITMLIGHVTTSAVVGAAVSYNVVDLYVTVAVLVSGVVVAAFSGILPAPYDTVLWASTAVFAAFAGILWWMMRRGLAHSLLAIAPSLRARWGAKLADLDERLREVHARRKIDRIEGFVLLLAPRILSWLETWVLLRAVGLDVGAGTLAAIVLGGTVVGPLASVLPLGIGVADLGAAALFSVLGLPPASGVAIALLRRMRQIVMALCGLAAMFALQTYDKIVHLRARRRILAHRAA